MEGVGARFGRSSSRYGPAPVFTGPVRKWKKHWVQVQPSNSGQNLHASANDKDYSRLMLFKWTPSAQELTNDDTGNDKDADGGTAVAVSPKRKFKYIPITALEDKKNDFSEQDEDESKLMVLNSKPGGFGEKPDINDVPVDENQSTESNHKEWQDLNVDLSLG